MEKKLSYEDLCSQIEVTSIDFLVDYSLEDPDDNLGALSPFIIDVDVDTTTALIRAEYRLKTDEKTLWSLLESKKRLFFFVTVPIETAFRAFLVTLVGEENILTYEQFMKMVH